MHAASARCTPPPWAAWKGTVCLAYPSVFLDKPLAVAKGLYVAEVTDKTATFEPRARVVRVDWVESDALHGVVTPKVVYELV